MVRKQFGGGAVETTLNGSITNSATSATLTDGSTYPDGSVGPFVLVLDPETASEEKVLVTARSSNNLSGMTRGYDGTSAASHSTGAVVRHVFDAISANEANAHVNDDTVDDHSQYLKTDGTRAATGVTAIAAVPGSSAVGDVAAKGAGPTLATSDHVHGREAFATPTRLAFANAAGSATTVPHSDHVHQRELIPCLRLQRAATQNCPSAADTAISWDTENKDTDSMWSSGTTITFNKAGAYTITLQMDYGFAVPQYIELWFAPSVGTTQPNRVEFNTDNGTSQHLLSTTWAFDAAAAETMTAGIAHTTAGAASMLVTAKLNVIWLGPTA